MAKGDASVVVSYGILSIIWGILQFLIALTLLCGYLFGVTIEGKHYSVGCACTDGVELKE